MLSRLSEVIGDDPYEENTRVDEAHYCYRIELIICGQFCLVMPVTKRDRWESTSQRASNV
jgi:hypothetical protein